MKGVVISAFATLGYFGTLIIVGTRIHPFVAMDFGEMFSLAQATLHGANPYAPPLWIHLGAAYHPTPMPPTLGVLTAPLAMESDGAAFILWWFIQAVCWFGGIIALVRYHRPAAPLWQPAILASIGLLWWPIINNLGETQLLQFALLAFALVAQKNHRPGWHGLLLALCVLVKPFCLPLLACPVLRRDRTRAHGSDGQPVRTRRGVGLAQLRAA